MLKTITQNCKPSVARAVFEHCINKIIHHPTIDLVTSSHEFDGVRTYGFKLNSSEYVKRLFVNEQPSDKYLHIDNMFVYPGDDSIRVLITTDGACYVISRFAVNKFWSANTLTNNNAIAQRIETYVVDLYHPSDEDTDDDSDEQANDVIEVKNGCIEMDKHWVKYGNYTKSNLTLKPGDFVFSMPRSHSDCSILIDSRSKNIYVSDSASGNYSTIKFTGTMKHDIIRNMSNQFLFVICDNVYELERICKTLRNDLTHSNITPNDLFENLLI